MDPVTPSAEDVLRRELAEVRSALAAAAEERDTLEGMLRREQTTRFRNLLAIIRSVFRRTVATATSLEDVDLHFAGRFDALVRFGKTAAAGQGAELEDIIRDELLVVGESDREGIRIAGPAAWLTPRQAPLVGLAVHELVTNAVKFGALATPGARLSISWQREGGAAGDALRLVWDETKVPVIAPAPVHNGFGREYLEQALPYQLQAETLFELRPGGVHCEIAFPLAAGE